MTDANAKIAQIIADAERAAYERGWRDARAALLSAADKLQPETANPLGSKALPPNITIVRKPSRGRPSSKAIDVVRECINATPGMKGVEVVKAAQSVDATIKERTVRTCLRRLRLSKTIWKRGDCWYPKAKENVEINSGPAAELPLVAH